MPGDYSDWSSNIISRSTSHSSSIQPQPTQKNDKLQSALQDELVGSEQLLEGESQGDQLEGSEQSSQLLEGDSHQSGHLLDQTDKLQENSERGTLCILILITVCYQVALVLHGELVFVFLSPSVALVSCCCEAS